MIFTPLSIAGAYAIDVERREDARGFFGRMWCERELTAHGLDARMAQVNVSVSPSAGTLRGLHFQRPPHEETKIVRCNRGSVYDVLVDLRRESATFRKWMGVELTGQSGQLLCVPKGCAHGFLTLSDDAEVMYFTSEFYAPEAATGVRYDDPALQIVWPREVLLVSDADRSWPLLET